MSLSNEINDFYNSWLSKADSYKLIRLNDYYNKAFTLFTLYNRLYAEATFILARNGTINLRENHPFPDSKGAKKYCPQFIGYSFLYSQLSEDSECNYSINKLINLLQHERFYIKLKLPFGEPQREKDIQLLTDLMSSNTEKKISAILDLIYSVRCNMFHGSKSFNRVQTDLLEPVITLLRKIVVILYSKLNSNNET